ncbi:MAG: RNA methyltransferase [Rhodospirillales bacterium]|nr:RNA methyltransferase [Rhodospirillales bacterium]
MRGYFGIGAEGINKTMNVGNLFRTAHAFGASFVFTVAATYAREEGAKSDTSDSLGHVPFYSFPDIQTIQLPEKCALVGIELTPDAVELPSFHHPSQAAYVLGPERGSISASLTERCDHIIKIPTAFCVNVGIAGAIVMYDRIKSLGKFPRRPARPGGPSRFDALPAHQHGEQVIRSKMAAFRDTPPEGYND